MAVKPVFISDDVWRDISGDDADIIVRNGARLHKVGVSHRDAFWLAVGELRADITERLLAASDGVIALLRPVGFAPPFESTEARAVAGNLLFATVSLAEQLLSGQPGGSPAETPDKLPGCTAPGYCIVCGQLLPLVEIPEEEEPALRSSEEGETSSEDGEPAKPQPAPPDPLIGLDISHRECRKAAAILIANLRGFADELCAWFSREGLSADWRHKHPPVDDQPAVPSTEHVPSSHSYPSLAGVGFLKNFTR